MVESISATLDARDVATTEERVSADEEAGPGQRSASRPVFESDGVESADHQFHQYSTVQGLDQAGPTNAKLFASRTRRSSNPDPQHLQLQTRSGQTLQRQLLYAVDTAKPRRFLGASHAFEASLDWRGSRLRHILFKSNPVVSPVSHRSLCPRSSTAS